MDVLEEHRLRCMLDRVLEREEPSIGRALALIMLAAVVSIATELLIR